MIYDIRHVTRFDYGGSVKFARCNLRLKPIHWSGQDLVDYRLTISPSGRTASSRSRRPAGMPGCAEGPRGSSGTG